MVSKNFFDASYGFDYFAPKVIDLFKEHFTINYSYLTDFDYSITIYFDNYYKWTGWMYNDGTFKWRLMTEKHCLHYDSWIPFEEQFIFIQTLKNYEKNHP